MIILILSLFDEFKEILMQIVGLSEKIESFKLFLL